MKSATLGDLVGTGDNAQEAPGTRPPFGSFYYDHIPKPRNTRLLFFGKTHKPFYVHSGGMYDDK